MNMIYVIKKIQNNKLNAYLLGDRVDISKTKT